MVDGLTKALLKDKFIAFRNALGLKYINIKKSHGRTGNGHDPPATALLRAVGINITQKIRSTLLSKIQSKTYAVNLSMSYRPTPISLSGSVEIQPSGGVGRLGAQPP